MNNASGGDGIPADLFLTLKMMLLNYCTQYATKFWKHSRGHSTGKGQFSSQTQRKAIPKNVQIIVQLHSFHMIARLCSKSFTSVHWIIAKAKEFQRNTYFCFESLWLCGSQHTGKFLKRWEYQTILPVSWDTCMWIKKQELEPYMELLLLDPHTGISGDR